ncbi:hypothetical protein [Ruminococcus sp.]|jgi:hypothetical protein|nr:hypothetical protein [Ruminococcus sp.]
MANFAELNAKEMDETNGGSLPMIPTKAIVFGASVLYTAYALYQAKRK